MTRGPKIGSCSIPEKAEKKNRSFPFSLASFSALYTEVLNDFLT